MLLGQCDPPLVDQPVPAVNFEPQAIYTSTLKRAKQSGQLLFQNFLEMRALPELNEISYGDWDGLTWDAIAAADPEMAQRKLEDWTAVTPPGGESWGNFTARVGSAFELIRRGPFPVAIVAHEGVNAVLANLLEGGSILAFRQEYWQVNRYECAPL